MMFYKFYKATSLEAKKKNQKKKNKKKKNITMEQINIDRWKEKTDINCGLKKKTSKNLSTSLL